MSTVVVGSRQTWVVGTTIFVRYPDGWPLRKVVCDTRYWKLEKAEVVNDSLEVRRLEMGEG